MNIEMIRSKETAEQEVNGPETNEEVEALIKERDELSGRRQEFLDNRILRREVELHPERLTDEGFEAMIHRIENETSVFTELEDTVKVENIIAGLAAGNYPVKVEFGDKTEGQAGSYSYFDRKIRIAKDAPSQQNLWKSFAYSGLPDVIATLDHELVHSEYRLISEFEQKHTRSSIKSAARICLDKMKVNFVKSLLPVFERSEPMSKGNLMQRKSVDLALKVMEWYLRTELDRSMALLQKDRLVSEILAQKAGSVYRREKSRTIDLIKTLGDYYGYDKPEDIDRIIATSQTIDRMKACGLTDTQIAAAFAGAEFDPTTATYPDLENGFEKTLAKNNISLDDIDVRIDINRLERDVNLIKSAVIAQEELAVAYAEQTLGVTEDVDGKEREIMEIAREIDHFIEHYGAWLGDGIEAWKRRQQWAHAFVVEEQKITNEEGKKMAIKQINKLILPWETMMQDTINIIER